MLTIARSSETGSACFRRSAGESTASTCDQESNCSRGAQWQGSVQAGRRPQLKVSGQYLGTCHASAVRERAVQMMRLWLCDLARASQLAQ
eukprot:3923011-Prymnesium_polylepis.2